MTRSGETRRETTETKVEVRVDLDGGGGAEITTTIPFLDHMLTLLARHGHLGVRVQALGDTEVDLHHTVEDVGIGLGEALRAALGKREGIRRYGEAAVPMDEALATAHVDLCTRPYLVYRVAPVPGQPESFDTDLAEQFFRALVSNLQATVHLAVPYGTNRHHVLEALFKAFGRALGEAATPDPRVRGALSTKGVL